MESYAEITDTKISMPSLENTLKDHRSGAVTPAAHRLSRPLEAIDVPHKKVDKICCLGAGYVGMSFLSSIRMAFFTLQ